jgi:hypothetical protein
MNCHVCGSREFSYTRVLWKELIEEWQLAEYDHGSQGETGSEFLVRTEFGSDVWKYVVEAGFQSSTFHCVDYPAGIAIEARV